MSLTPSSYSSETTSPGSWIYRNRDLLLCGSAMLMVGWMVTRSPRGRAVVAASSNPVASGSGAPFPGASLDAGDEAPEGTPGTGEAICRECGGSGRNAAGTCPACGGDGKVTVALAGG